MKALATVLTLVALTIDGAHAASGTWTAEGVSAPAVISVASSSKPKAGGMLIGVVAFRGAIVEGGAPTGSTDPAARLVICRAKCIRRALTVTAFDVDAEGTIMLTGTAAKYGATTLVWKRASPATTSAGFCTGGMAPAPTISYGYRFGSASGYATTLTGRIGSWPIREQPCSVATIAERVSFGLSWTE